MTEDASLEGKKTDLKVTGDSDPGKAENQALLSDPESRVLSNDTAKFPKITDDIEVIELIGKGGMGSVYKAFDRVLQKEVAVKILHSELAKDKASQKRFELEAKAAEKLSHPNLVSVYKHGETQTGAPYIVMDYCDGKSLSEILKESGALTPKQVLEYVIQIAEALSHAHENGVIHRDIKPTNIIVSSTAEGSSIAQIVDFGIAKVMPTENRTTHNLTETGEVFGSPNYMSPEQCLGFMLDSRSDIYSIGCMLYELTTGEPPFAGSNPIQVVVKHINDDVEPFPLSIAIDQIGGGLESVTMRCLEKDQATRYQDSSELIKDLKLIKEGKAPARYKKKAKQKREFTKRQVIGTTVGIAAIVFYSMVSSILFSQQGMLLVLLALLLNGLVIGGMYVSYGSFKEQYESIKDRKTTINAWWQLVLSGSFGAMCTTILPFSIFALLTIPGFIFPFLPAILTPTWWEAAIQAATMVNVFCATLCFSSLIGRFLFSGKKKIGPWRIVGALVAIFSVLIIVACIAFPSQMGALIRNGFLHI